MSLDRAREIESEIETLTQQYDQDPYVRTDLLDEIDTLKDSEHLPAIYL